MCALTAQWMPPLATVLTFALTKEASFPKMQVRWLWAVF